MRLLGGEVLGLLQASVIPSEKWVPEVPSALEYPGSQLPWLLLFRPHAVSLISPSKFRGKG